KLFVEAKSMNTFRCLIKCIQIARLAGCTEGHAQDLSRLIVRHRRKGDCTSVSVEDKDRGLISNKNVATVASKPFDFTARKIASLKITQFRVVACKNNTIPRIQSYRSVGSAVSDNLPLRCRSQ